MNQQQKSQEFEDKNLFIQALLLGDVETIQDLVNSSRVDINTDLSPFAPYTPLNRSISEGNIKIVNLLISLGADVNRSAYPPAKSFDYPNVYSPLYYASLKGDYDMCQLLISHGANFGDLENFEGVYSEEDITGLDIFKLILENTSMEDILYYSRPKNGFIYQELKIELINEKYRRIGVKEYLFLSREFDEDSLFYKENLPWDLFNIIIEISIVN